MACGGGPFVIQGRQKRNPNPRRELARLDPARVHPFDHDQAYPEFLAPLRRSGLIAWTQQWPMPEWLRSGLGLRRLVDVVTDVGRISTRSFEILGSIRKPSTIITLEPDVKTKQIPRLRPTSPACCTRTTRLRTFSSSTSRTCGYHSAMAVLGSAEWSLPADTTHRPRAPTPRAGLAHVASRAGPCALSHSLCKRSWTPSCFPDNKKQLR